MKMAFLVLLLIISSIQTFAGGNHVGNGGDLCELRFNSIRDDLQSWINKDGSSELQLPANLVLDTYNLEMTKMISLARVNCIEDKVKIGSVEKTCINFTDEQGNPKITCNLKRFMETVAADQYVLVHHEFAGLANIETNADEESQYFLSKQITGFLEIQNEKRLVIKPNPQTVCATQNQTTSLEDQLMKSIKDGNLVCVQWLASQVKLNSTMETHDRVQGTRWGTKLSPLGYAAMVGNAKAIQLLIDAGAYIHFVNIQVDYAIYIASILGNIDAIEVLVKNGAFLNYNSVGSRSVDSPLGTAIYNGYMLRRDINSTYDTVEILLDLGADPHLFSGDATPLQLATINTDLIDLLVEYKADPNFRNNSGRSAIFYCYTEACVESLIKHGADINQEDFEHDTPVDAAVFGNLREIFIKHGGKPGIKPPK